MCTLLIAYHAHPAAPFVVAANRDEFYARPTSGPRRLFDTPHVAIGGRDLQFGGSWMGLNALGLFAGLTNMRNADRSRRSRGEVVVDALRCATPAEVSARLREHASAGEYRPFNLLFGNQEALFVAYGREGLTFEAVEPGLHVLPSGGVLDDPVLPKVRRARALLEAAASEPDPDALVAALYRALADDHVPELPPALRGTELGDELMARVLAINVKTEAYGTRSSTIVLTGGGQHRYYFAEGAPPAELRRVDGLFDDTPGSDG